MKKLIIFDLDGTLIDSLADIRACCNEVLAQFSLPPIDEAHARAYVGNGAKKLVERMLGERIDLLDQVYPVYLERFRNYSGRTKLYPAERETLDTLAKRGCRFAVVTNKPDAAAKNVVQKCLPGMYVAGQKEGGALKPDPTLTLSVMRLFGAEREDCVFVGDGETDIQTAANAGISCISVLWGYRSKEQLLAAGGKVFAENYEELGRIIAAM